MVHRIVYSAFSLRIHRIVSLIASSLSLRPWLRGHGFESLLRPIDSSDRLRGLTSRGDFASRNSLVRSSPMPIITTLDRHSHDLQFSFVSPICCGNLEPFASSLSPQPPASVARASCYRVALCIALRRHPWPESDGGGDGEMRKSGSQEERATVTSSLVSLLSTSFVHSDANAPISKCKGL